MENFIYNTPTKIFFGKKEEEKIGSIISSYKFKKILFHYGKSSIKKSGLYDLIISKLKENNIDYVELGGVEPNPKLSLVLKGVEICKKENIDFILAVGGGSVLDSAKLISSGALVDFNPWLFSIKEKISTKHIPVGTILTISASGSDMSNSCVITNDLTKEKRGFNSEENRPLFAILDPELTYTVSSYQTACGITDIMMHTLERYFSLGEDTPLTDNIALGLLKSVYDAGIIVMNDPYNYNARATLMWANSLSHNGLTSCGRQFLMSVHQLEHELSGMYDNISHGAGLAALWPSWARVCYTGCKSRFKKFSNYMFGIEITEDDSDILKGITTLEGFFKEIGMPTSLHELGVKEDTLEALAYNTMYKGKRTLKDIIEIDYNTALKILKMAY